MGNVVSDRPRRVLDPVERVSEILFGIIMVLTFTGSISVAEPDREEVKTLLVGAIGCNLAWGIVDAVMYVMARLTERARTLALLRFVRSAADRATAGRLIMDQLPSTLGSCLGPAEIETVRQRIVALPEPPRYAHVSWEDLRGALGVFLLVFLSTFPVVIPFLLVQEAHPALRISNAVAVAMLFASGFILGRHAHHRPLLTGLAMVAVGVLLVGLTMALGG